ncbi:hypothetical protein BVG16_13220 [Paenibacillus selenitireducens]|uniref:DUF2332 domain-containing protein n=1 Tax=Paenibacillus selenitireducens TaxID=1324314 RepID=A0A1T2XC65_9BACL|nr:DUF2332 domain-containing protein [Paenibacillus selenitireducens]OPA77415.1 hypothetical protein BVG16_13220 [Paenibacillus selenitireducens]
MDIADISQRFKQFSQRECEGSSPLYALLANRIAEDNEILQLAACSRANQPIPNLFLAAVHYLLLDGAQHGVSQYYDSIVRDPQPIDPETYLYLRDFCLQHKKEMIELLENKRVQTNEVRRCAYLYPSFCHIYGKTHKPLSLIEIGTSAGLQLNWDNYRYSYNHTECTFGDDLSKVHITSELRGAGLPTLLKNSPPVVYKMGLDLHRNDLSNPDHYLWMKALIWPEHRERAALFDQAAASMNSYPLQITEGDGIALLPDILKSIPEGTTVCIFHTHVANQIPYADKMKLLAYIQQLGLQRDVFHLYNNMWDLDLHLDYFLNGEAFHETLAAVDGHARWFEWKGKGCIDHHQTV